MKAVNFLIIYFITMLHENLYFFKNLIYKFGILLLLCQNKSLLGKKIVQKIKMQKIFTSRQINYCGCQSSASLQHIFSYSYILQFPLEG